MKVCSMCKQKKEETEFNKNHCRCKVCSKEYNKQYWKEHKEQMSKQQKQYRRTPKGKEVQRKATAKYVQTVPGKFSLLKSQRKYRMNKAWDSDPEYRNEVLAFQLCNEQIL